LVSGCQKGLKTAKKTAADVKRAGKSVTVAEQSSVAADDISTDNSYTPNLSDDARIIELRAENSALKNKACVT